jgi:hypothetical protein
MGVILDAYTVYFDLVLCDSSGRVVANGRPEKFNSLGQDQSSAVWFRKAMQSANGNEFGFQSAHRSTLVGNRQVLAYSCGVRTGGEANGQVLGVLGILFNWSGLAEPIVTKIPVDVSEQDLTEAYIIDQRGILLATNTGATLGSVLELPEINRVFENTKGFFVAKRAGRRICIGHARAPGFETYSTGWYSIVVQPADGGH